MTRIASSPFAMWRDICQTNAGPIREMIDAYLDALVAIREKVDREALSDDFDYANRIRGEIPKDSKGFLHPLHEILLVAEDKPGVIADVASRLSAEGINIEDIEVLKVREGEGGDDSDGVWTAGGRRAVCRYFARCGLSSAVALEG